MTRLNFAYILNEYLHTLGGGERQSFDFALALQELGFETHIVTPNEPPILDKICDLFGEQYANLKFRVEPRQMIFDKLRAEKPAIFVNQSSNSRFPSPARFGIYAQMFPIKELRKSECYYDWAQMSSYQLMLCNSTYTAQYTKAFWDFPCEKVQTLHPPIWPAANALTEAGFQNFQRKKRKEILHIGRFNPGNHNKNQLLIIQAFLEFSAILPDWKLRLIGNVNSDRDSQSYFAQCVDLAEKSNGQIEILAGVSTKDLNNFIESAFIYLHATGAFTPSGIEPEKCEHLGLSILEAAAQACIPAVYNRGGIFDLLTVGESCLVYSTREELTLILKTCEKLWNSEMKNRLQRNAWSAAIQNNFTNFKTKLSQMIPRELFEGTR